MPDILSISPGIDLVDGASYDIKLEYQDLPGNSPVSLTQGAVVFTGNSTIPPTLSLPVANTKIPLEFDIEFTLPRNRCQILYS